MFGYIDDCKLDFIAENCGTMIAMLVPFVIKYEKCLRLVEEICDIVQKDLASTIAVSFLSIYTNLYVNEATDVSEQCLQFLVQKTARSLNVLLKSDIKVISSSNRMHRCVKLILIRFVLIHSEHLPRFLSTIT